MIPRNKFATGMGFALLLTFMLLTSCVKDEELDSCTPSNEESCDYICFGFPADRQMAGAGYSDKDEVSDRFMLRSADSADSLYMSAVVTDGINIAGHDRSAVMTRSAMVTDFGSFHVQTALYKNSTLETISFMNESVTKGETKWTTENTYYWPGAGFSLDFYAWYPDSAGLFAVADNGKNATLTYTVHTAAKDQKDIMVASATGVAGDNNKAVPLSFKHIFTAVRFVVGSQMQPGTIKSIALKGVSNIGTYDIAGGWTLSQNATGDFVQELNKEMTGSEPAGDEITPADSTFMMLPQTLPAGATVEVVFSNASGDARTLTASIAGSEWPMGKTVTYKLSVSPEYELELTDENPVLDAHYEIFQTTLKVTDMPAGTQWTVTANSDATIILQSELNDYAKQGFWTDRFQTSSAVDGLQDKGSARGAASFSGTGSGEFPIAIFVPENTGETSRTIDLSVKVANRDVAPLVLTQLAPSWNGTLGCERIESDPCQWGFYWSSDFKIIYDLTSCANADRENIHDYIKWTQTIKDLSEKWWIGWLVKWIFGNNIPDLSFVSMETSDIGRPWFPNNIADKITIDLGSISTSGIALNPNDGQSNTAEIYNFEGISLVNDMISRVESISGYRVTTEGTGVFPTHNASVACMKLNSWDVVTVDKNTILKLKTEKPSWYLPAQTEAPQMTDTEYPLNGIYWTSTAENNNQNAYIWNAGESSANGVARRDENHNVRAVRQKP